MAIKALPRGPTEYLLAGNLPDFARDRLGFLSSLRAYGDIVPFRLGPHRAVLLNDPALIEEVLVTKQRYFVKFYLLRMNRLLLGNGLLTSEGAFWLRQRRLAQPAFHKQRIVAYGETMVAYTQDMMETWHDGERRDVHAEMMRLTLRIVAKTLFDADTSGAAATVGTVLEVVLRDFTRRMDSLLQIPDYVPTPMNLRRLRAARQLDRIVYGIIAQHRHDGQDRGDLLSLLLHARDEDGSGMTDKQLRDEVMTFFLAGHETTAIALSWTWHLLSQHPEVEARLAGELDTVLQGRIPSTGDLSRLRYTGAVVAESLRLYPPAYGFGREAIAPCEIGGYRIPAGMSVIVSPWVTQRDPRFFADPDRFRPERWFDGSTDSLPRFAYFPFGGGPRICIGNQFALMEAALILATVAQRYWLEPVEGARIEPYPSLTLRPRFGVPLRLCKRANRSLDGTKSGFYSDSRYH